MVFGKYEDDQWYRCLITDFNETHTKFELYFLDFGNTSTLDSADIMYAWSKEQTELFVQYAPEAFFCKLYGIRGVNGEKFTSAQNGKFKKFLENKVFNVRFVSHNIDTDQFEVSLDDENEYASAHFYLCREKIGNINNIFKNFKVSN